MSSTDSIQKAGDITIEALKLLSATGYIVDLDIDLFFIELNLYEDIFAGSLYGDILISDSRNLIEKLPITGEEFLILKIKTPSFPTAATISKVFRIYQLTDRAIVKENTQMYTLHFVSHEMIADILLPLYRSFEGNIDDVVIQIFEEYIAINRNFDDPNNDNLVEKEATTQLKVLTETANKVKFVSPGWSPFKCINWLASKAIPKEGKACNFLFFESNKSFYFTSIETIFDFTNKNKSFVGEYTLAAANIRDEQSKTDINRELLLTESVEMITTTDHIKNYTNGYLANRLITLDVFNKVYDLIDYDHVNQYKNYIHSSGEKSVPIFAENSVRNPASSIHFYPINPKLFTGFSGNVNEKIKDIYGNRKSTLLELTNLKLLLTVPGRTDIEVGAMIKFKFPSLGPKDESDKQTDAQDKLYSGYYIITSIHHKINRNEHKMIMEVVKDSLVKDES